MFQNPNHACNGLNAILRFSFLTMFLSLKVNFTFSNTYAIFLTDIQMQLKIFQTSLRLMYINKIFNVLNKNKRFFEEKQLYNQYNILQTLFQILFTTTFILLFSILTSLNFVSFSFLFITNIF